MVEHILYCTHDNHGKTPYNKSLLRTHVNNVRTAAAAIVDLMCAYFATQIFRSVFFIHLSFFLFRDFFSTFYSGLGDPIKTHRMEMEAIHFS